MATENGTITGITFATAGSALLNDISVGATQLPVQDAAVFTEHGQVTLGGETLTYVSVNYDTDILWLQAPTAQQHYADDPVLIYPASTQKMAAVLLNGPGDDSIMARIPLTMNAVISDGVEGPVPGQAVIVDLVDYEWVVTDLPGEEATVVGAQVDASTIDASTIDSSQLDGSVIPDIPIPDVNTGNIASDGNAPSASPAVTVSDGIDCIFVNWDAVDNADPVTYRLYMSTTTPVAIDAGHLLADNIDATIYTVTGAPGGQPLQYGVMYHFCVVAVDTDGAAAAGAEGQGQFLHISQGSFDGGLQASINAIDTKNGVYFQTTAPTGGTYSDGDLWFDSDDGYKPYERVGASWVARQFGSSAISAASINAGHIQAGSVTADKISGHSITAAQIAAGTITSTEIAALTITASNIAASTITGSKIAAGTITASNIAASTITATQIAAGTITGTQIQAGSITATQLAVGTITADRIVAGSITTNQIQNGTITGGDIASDTVTGGNITNGTITGTEVAPNSISTGHLVANAIDGMLITGATIQTATSGSRVRMLGAPRVEFYVGSSPNYGYIQAYQGSFDSLRIASPGGSNPGTRSIMDMYAGSYTRGVVDMSQTDVVWLSSLTTADVWGTVTANNTVQHFYQNWDHALSGYPTGVVLGHQQSAGGHHIEIMIGPGTTASRIDLAVRIADGAPQDFFVYVLGYIN